MKTIWQLIALCICFESATLAVLPFFTTHPTNQIVAPSNTVTFVAQSSNATAYQWRLNGVDIPAATNISLVITNAQTNNIGYYMAVAKNSTGWTPSRMGYLSVVGSTMGVVPFNTKNIPTAQANYQIDYCFFNYRPITNGTATLVAGPALDWMVPVVVNSHSVVSNGYFPYAGSNPPPPALPLPTLLSRNVPNVAPGQDIFYRVDVSYAIPCNPSSIFTQQSTTLKLIAGGSGFPTPSINSLRFPYYIEWPDPSWAITPTDMHGVTTETLMLKYGFYSVTGNQPASGIQWRKDGKDFGAPQSGTLTLTNLTANDAGVYDVYATGGGVSYLMPSQKLFLSVQTVGGQGQFKNPRKVNSSFVSDLDGAAGRNYQILCSTNLSIWSNLLVVTNVTGTASFTNTMGSTRQYYRAMLLP